MTPNKFPTISTSYRLAIIGEAPGRDEEIAGEPFVGASGRFLSAMLTQANIARSACFIGNVCQTRPPNNDISAFDFDGDEIQDGLQRLRSDLQQWPPHLCLLLGNTALRAALGRPESISLWRGSLFLPSDVSSHFIGRKCMGTYHPAAILRQYEWAPILKFDLARARTEAETPTLTIPERNLLVPEHISTDDWFAYIITTLDEILQTKPLISVDIEGGVNTLSCISIATSATHSFIIPFTTAAGSYWSSEQEAEVWRRLSRVLGDPGIPKVLQNSLYDNFVLSYSYNCPIRGVTDDTMLKHWELYSELEKSLAFQASIYTKEPYYKSDRKVNSLPTFWRYCCRDSATTYEINRVLDTPIAKSDVAKKHYAFNISLLPAMLYMELRGIRYDHAGAIDRRKSLGDSLHDSQVLLNELSGRALNVSSPKQMADYLYSHLGLPTVTNRKTGRPTANYEAILSLAKKTGHPALTLILKIRSESTRERMLRIHPDHDGRIRCSYNLVGTETGRLTCYTSPTGSGYNLQTIPEHDRDLFIADPGHYLFQCDLSGADGWTVAAHCAAQGDDTMLLDLKAGVKIAKVIALMFKYGPEKIAQLSRQDLKAATEEIAKTDPLYFGSKCCQHGSNYGMGPVLLSATIFTQSEGTVNIPTADARRLQDLYFSRYVGIRRWHEWVARKLRTDGKLTSASGHTRLFFGRRDDPSTTKAALSNEPQENTTYATNLAAHRLWHDPDNRRDDGRLIVEPLHQVHDALLGQFRRDETEFACRKINEWFNNTLVIAGRPLIIPFEGRYGPSWGDLSAGTI